MQNIEINPNREYILIGDISGSMNQSDKKCFGATRYNFMIEKFQQFIKQAEEYDPTGPDVILFGEKVHIFPDTTLETIKNEFGKPVFEGFTFLDKAINAAYKLHRDKKSAFAKERKFHPGTICMIFTDGAPTNQMAVEEAIVNIANSIDREDEFNIYILTVGTIDGALQNWLDHLHDGLEPRLKQDFDIIHVNELELVDFFTAVKGKDHD